MTGFIREVPNTGDSGAGDSSARLLQASNEAVKHNERVGITKPGDFATTTSPESFSHPIQTANLNNFGSILQETLAKYDPALLASTELPEPLKSFLKTTA